MIANHYHVINECTLTYDALFVYSLSLGELQHALCYGCRLVVKDVVSVFENCILAILIIVRYLNRK